jgi:hypothetical protein
MQLSARFLNDVSGVNSFEIANQVEFFAGDNQTIYFQLVDASLDRPEQGFSPAGRRYMPASGSTLQVTFMSVDDAKKVVRMATQPFATDPSIWSVALLPSDPMKGTVSLKFVLTEPSRTLNASFVPGLLLRVQ